MTVGTMTVSLCFPFDELGTRLTSISPIVSSSSVGHTGCAGAGHFKIGSSTYAQLGRIPGCRGSLGKIFSTAFFDLAQS